MENPTQETIVALLQQSMQTLTASIARIEITVNKIDEATRNYVTIETLKEEYVSKDAYRILEEKIKNIGWILGVVFVASVTAIINSIFRLIGGK